MIFLFCFPPFIFNSYLLWMNAEVGSLLTPVLLIAIATNVYLYTSTI